MMKNGTRTSEFWLAIIVMILGTLQKYVDVDIPTEAFIVVIAYILSRLGIKLQENGTKKLANK